MRSKDSRLEEEGYQMSEEIFEALLAPNLQSAPSRDYLRQIVPDAVLRLLIPNRLTFAMADQGVPRLW